MKRSKFTEEQIAYALRQVESGTSPANVRRQLGVSEATFYVWKKKYAHLGVSELRRLRSLEDENVRLKPLVADLLLDKHMLSEALRKKSEAHTPPRAACLVPGDLRRQLCACLSSGAVQPCGPVSEEHSAGPDGAGAADSRTRARTATVWLPSHLGALTSGRLAREQEAGPATVSIGGPATADADAPAETHRAASGPRPLAHWSA